MDNHMKQIEKIDRQNTIDEIATILKELDTYDSKECEECKLWTHEDKCDLCCFAEQTAKFMYNKGIRTLKHQIAIELPNKHAEIITAHGDNFTFEYGIVTFKHRFSINRSLDDYEEITLNKCIRIGLEYKYYKMACDKLIAELQIVYKDDDNKLQCLKKDLHEWTFRINHKGDMMIRL